MTTPDLPSDVVARRIREARKRRGWTPAQLAERCAELGAPEITVHTITNIESGRRDKETGRRRRHVTVDELLTLAAALNVAPVHLLVPLKEETYHVTPTLRMSTVHLRSFIRGLEPYVRGDGRTYFTETPDEEADIGLTADEVRRVREVIRRFNGGDDGRR